MEAYPQLAVRTDVFILAVNSLVPTWGVDRDSTHVRRRLVFFGTVPADEKNPFRVKTEGTSCPITGGGEEA